MLTAGARRIADEIRLSIEYYHTTVPDARRVEPTVMAGPGIAIEGLPAFFETELGMPVQPRSMGQVEVKPGRARRRRGGRAHRRHRPRPRRGARVRPINLIPLEQRRGPLARGRCPYQLRRLRRPRRPRRSGRVRARRRDDLEPDQLEDRGARRRPGRGAGREAGRRRAASLRPVRRPPACAHDSRSRALPRAASTGSARCASSLAIPRNVWLLSVSGTQSPNVELDGGAGGDISSMREKTPAPAFTISGCTYSQHAVARMMTRMRNLDDVTAVRLAKSVRKDASDAVRRDCRHGGPAAGAAGGGHPGLHRL